MIWQQYCKTWYHFVKDTIASGIYWFLHLGIMKISLLIIFPLAFIKVYANLNSQEKYIITSPPGIDAKAYQSPFRDFCEIDSTKDKCIRKCIKYDQVKFKSANSIATFFAGGRLGNMITAYLSLLWVHLDHGLDVYYERKSYRYMSQIFEDLKLPILENTFCDWRLWPFEKYNDRTELLGDPVWKKGRAIRIHFPQENYLKGELFGGRKYYRNYRKESLKALKFKTHFRRHAEITLQGIAKKVNPKNPNQVIFVGIHDRRTDYLDFRKNKLGLRPIYKDYFTDAMEYFKEEYEEDGNVVAFVYVSDEMKWGRRNLRSNDTDIFFVGCGDGNSVECVGKDFSVLSSCNHTITTHGSFGHWAAYLASGEVYTEYGSIVPDSYA